ncbi:hypothetical protein HanRHA438_Chr12g0542491 [Helianthus annuus]|nr:hypothetical protein HanRHA438_Chr12g0542491 [Helianthus annuus]
MSHFLSPFSQISSPTQLTIKHKYIQQIIINPTVLIFNFPYFFFTLPYKLLYIASK